MIAVRAVLLGRALPDVRDDLKPVHRTIMLSVESFMFFFFQQIEVTDSDFCEFNKDRTEKSFSENQIWACYDSLDVMPRGYVMINKVIFVDPFKVCITHELVP
ncbi:unnamed protein product [Eruca vesicaria subsp. sativa]|uniref:DUF3444 domain-containing protein n=1 Tax=Eruca vesicaria subsp. sativa TaxID=29727 RepID=A0ABC8M7P0_ERUVS|nr:unnamed protein product [Eruca vesicaria subsp. sativa]